MSETLKPCPVLLHTDAGMKSLDVQNLCRICPNRTPPTIPASVYDEYLLADKDHQITIRYVLKQMGCDIVELEANNDRP